MAVSRTVALGASVLFAAGCLPEAEDEGESGEVDEISRAITGGWTTVTLINGWQNYNSTDAPALGLVDGVVRFRGALKGPNATSTAAFKIPAAFRPYFLELLGSDQLAMRTVLSGSVGGSLMYEFDVRGLPTGNSIHVYQDGVSGLGSAAKTFTSLDGVTFDRTVDDSTGLDFSDEWGSVYPFRQRGMAGVYVKLVDGFVRFQGALAATGANATSYLFTLPTQYRPGQVVYVPVTLCPSSTGTGKYGRLKILPDGDVHVQADMAAARCMVSFEGASFSLTGGGTTLTLLNGWEPYSPRAVKARSTFGMVRLEGAVKNGTSTTIAQLPSTMRPARTVYLTSDSSGATQGRIYVTSSGNVVVQYPALDIADGFTSLDGLSFGL